jgi:hypothetical protein
MKEVRELNFKPSSDVPEIRSESTKNTVVSKIKIIIDKKLHKFIPLSGWMVVLTFKIFK